MGKVAFCVCVCELTVRKLLILLEESIVCHFLLFFEIRERFYSFFFFVGEVAAF